MKKKLALLLMLVLCIPAALAESDGYWTRNEDWYYHLSEICGGAEGMVPISQDGAAEFEKYPCPVCVPVKDGGEVQAVIAEGTNLVIVRIPDSCLKEWERTGDSSYVWDQCYEGLDAYQALGKYLSGEEYARFLRDYQVKGSADAKAVQLFRVLSYERPGMEFSMSIRHLNGAWYYVAYMEEGAQERWSVNLSGYETELHMEGGLFVSNAIGPADVDLLKLQCEQEGAEVLFEQTYGDVELRVTQLMGEYVAEIARPVEGDYLREAELFIGSGDGISLWSLVGDEEDDYVCVLTEAEFEALRGGAAVELYAQVEEKPQYFGTPYAKVLTDGRGYAIIDREGNVVVDYGVHEIISREASDGSFRFENGSKMTYADGWTLEPIEVAKES